MLMPHEQGAHVIIGGDGTVLAVSGSLPTSLVDMRLEHCRELPDDVREAGTELIQQSRRSDGRAATRSFVYANERLQLIAIEAVPMRRTETDIRALLASKLAVIASQALDMDATLRIETASDVPPMLRVDSEKVGWAVTTLVGNALRYMQPRSRRRRDGAVTVRTSFVPGRMELVVEVQDNGPGVQPETVARLFQRDALNVRGAGLALLLIHDVCAALGGTLEMRSSTGPHDHGTTVRMTFAVL
jgi:signal transduction histidine kinase